MKGRLSKTNGRAAAFALTALACAALLLSTALPRTTAAQTTAPARQSPGAHPDAEVERGRQLYLRGDYAGAAKVLGDAAKRLKEDADALHYLGLALNRAGKPKEARKVFERVVKLRPDSARARAGLALALALVYKTSEAESEARRALQLDPRLADALYVMGAASFVENKFEQTTLHADAALRLAPDFAPAQYLKGEALLYLYADESDRIFQKHRVPLDAPPPVRKRVHEARDAQIESELGPLLARMRAAADRIEAFAESQPQHPEAKDWRDQADTLRVYGRSVRKDSKEAADAPDTLPSSATVTKAAILSKPEPGYTDEARQAGVSGVVRLRMVLSADGTVKHILPLKRLSHGLTGQAVKAARRIKFEPAVKDGRRVSQYIIIEYAFRAS